MLNSTSLLTESKRTEFLRFLLAERSRRSRIKSDQFAQYMGDPVAFVEMGLLGFLWSKQKDICRSVVANRRTAVPSAHDQGKSYIAAALACWWISCFPPGEAFVVSLAPTNHQVRGVLWREIGRLHNAGRLPGYVSATEWKLENGELVGMGRSPRDGTAVQGIHQLRVLVILDEACGITKELWDSVDSLIANDASRILAIGNPDDPSSEFQSVCKPGSGWNVIPISAFESPNFTDEPVPDWLRPLLCSTTWVEERKHKWGEDSPIYQSKVLGKFPEQAVDGLVPLSALSAAVDRELEPAAPVELGVDVARFGRNHSVIYKRSGSVFRRINKFNNRDLMYVTGAVIAAIREHRPSKVKIDDTGLGGGVTDRLNELKRGEDAELLRNVSIVPVNVGEAPTVRPGGRRANVNDPTQKDKEKLHEFEDTERFFNLRAQINWSMRERFRSGDIDIDNNEDVLLQASNIKYRLTSRGQIQIEPKDEMEERLGSERGGSPDDWDALVLAGAEVGLTDAEMWAKFADVQAIL